MIGKTSGGRGAETYVLKSATGNLVLGEGVEDTRGQRQQRVMMVARSARAPELHDDDTGKFGGVEPRRTPSKSRHLLEAVFIHNYRWLHRLPPQPG